MQNKYNAYYINNAVRIFNDLGLETERGLAFAYDISVQNGSSGVGADFVNQVAAMPTDEEKMIAVANRMYSNMTNSGNKYAGDVYARKMTIAQGFGTVHGVSVNLALDYDIKDRIVTFK